MSLAPNSARSRSVRAEIRNPALALPAVRALRALDPDVRLLFAVLLHDLRRDARQRADACWTRRKAFMAAYWSVVAVYAGHFARALAGEGGRARLATPLLVRQEGFADLAACDWADASLHYCARRDILGLGQRDYPEATILVANRAIARISYNGRIWPAGAWDPAQQPIFDNRAA